jgi:hypothetical protein
VVKLSAVAFDGVRLAEAEVSAQGAAGTLPSAASFDAPPGPVQLALEIRDGAGKVLGTDVRYTDVPALDRPGASITAIDIIRTRSLPEFLARQQDANVMPSAATEFDHRDRLIIRVSASAAGEAPVVTARLLNALGQPIRELTSLPAVEGIPQFDLPLAAYARGDYRLEVRATAAGSTISQLVMFRLIG